MKYKGDVTPLTVEIIEILRSFGTSIDPEGYEDGNFQKAVEEILDLIRKQA